MPVKFGRSRDDPDATSRNAIAAELGVSVERVRQIETVALAKLRAALAARGIGRDDVAELLSSAQQLLVVSIWDRMDD